MLGQMKQMMMRKNISIKSEIEKVPKHDVTIVMGDLSAKVGNDNSGNERVMRKYAMETSTTMANASYICFMFLWNFNQR
jgi:hypothetical protein